MIEIIIVCVIFIFIKDLIFGDREKRLVCLQCTGFVMAFLLLGVLSIVVICGLSYLFNQEILKGILITGEGLLGMVAIILCCEAYT